MRTMYADAVETPTATYRLPILNLRWSGIFAGLVVGLSVHVLLMLAGAAIGLAVIDVGGGGERAVPVAAAVWNTVSMIISAFVGGYVAARSAGMRRSSDGVLHGAVAWGLTMLVSLLVAGTAVGTTFARLLGATPDMPAVAAQANGGVNRSEAAGLLQQRLGITAEQANSIIDQALALSGREEAVSPQRQAEAEEAMRATSAATGWLSGAILLSLLAGMGGGLLGARGTRRQERSDYRERRTVVERNDLPPAGTTRRPVPPPV